MRAHIFVAGMLFRYILVGCIDEKTKRTMVTIYDLRNKFISMSHLLPLGDTVRMVHHDGGVAYVITSSWALIRFQEKDTASKIEVLLRKSLYPLAISLASEEQSAVTEVIKLYRLYADHLYKKNDFEGAIAQYCHTIGHVQPSYVIRRFLDAQRIGNLTLYLEKLHTRGIATKDHTTLLLTCYTKTNDEAKISAFCQLHETAADTGSSSTNIAPLNFDVETAVQTLHESNFDEQALSLALHHAKHEEFIDISLSAKNKRDSQKALAYLVMSVVLPGVATMSEISHLVRKFGADFLRDTPAAFTALLIQLCTDTLDKAALQAFLAQDGAGDVTSGSGGDEEEEGGLWTDTGTVGGSKTTRQLDERLDVEDALSIYIDDSYEHFLRVFLEGVSARVGSCLPASVTELLLELYLVEYQASRCELLEITKGGGSGSGRSIIEISNRLKSIEDKVLGILDGASAANSEFDPSAALLLTQAFRFDAGELFLYDKLQSTDLILRKHIETGNERGIMQVLKREGRKDPELFIQVLSYFVKLSMMSAGTRGEDRSSARHTSSDTDDDDEEEEEEDEKWDAISEVLALVEKEDILTPMQIIPILSENPNLPLHVVSRFIKKGLQNTSAEVLALEHDVQHMRHLVQSIVQERVARRQQGDGHGHGASKDGKTHTIQLGGDLREFDGFDDDEDEFEAQQAEAERETERRKWANIKKAQVERTGDHESFFAELEHSNDGYATVAAYFGKTVIS
jgi:vacuolar protein sorting-associated protein 11